MTAEEAAQLAVERPPHAEPREFAERKPPEPARRIVRGAAYQFFKGRPILHPRVAQESEHGGTRAGFDPLTFGKQSPHVARQRQAGAIGPLKAHRRVNREQLHIIPQSASRRLKKPLEYPWIVEQRWAGVEAKAVALDQVGAPPDALVRLVDRYLITGQT